MTLWLMGAGIAAIAYIVTLFDCQQRLSPDGYYYLAMARGEKVPQPYVARWLLPRLLGSYQTAWRVASAVGLVIAGGNLAVLTGTPWATALFVGFSLFRTMTLLPVLTDAPAFALATGAACLAGRWEAIPLLLVLALVREPAALFVAAWTGDPTALGVGMVGITAARLIPGAPPDKEWLKRPFQTALEMHRGKWLSWWEMLLPWGPAAILCAIAVPYQHPWTLMLLAASVVLGYGQMVTHHDRPRLYQWAAPAVLMVAVQHDPWVLAVAVMIGVFNPYRGV